MNPPSAVALSRYHLDIASRYAELNNETVKSAIENMIVHTMLDWLDEMEDAAKAASDHIIDKANMLLPESWSLYLQSTTDGTNIALNVGLDYIPANLTPNETEQLQRGLSELSANGGTVEIGRPVTYVVRRRGNGLTFQRAADFGVVGAAKVSIPRSAIPTINEALGLAVQAQQKREKEQ